MGSIQSDGFFRYISLFIQVLQGIDTVSPRQGRDKYASSIHHPCTEHTLFIHSGYTMGGQRMD